MKQKGKNTSKFKKMKTKKGIIYTETEIKGALDELVEKQYLKKTKNGWIDSDIVKSLLKEGKTRRQIASILEKNTIL